MDNVRMNGGVDMNCGPVAIQIATGLAYEDIIHKWPGDWEASDVGTGAFGLPNDMPCDHYALLKDLGVSHRNITSKDILEGRAVPDRTVVLLHLVDAPRGFFGYITNFIRGFFAQHWVVFKGYTPDGRYMFDWGWFRVVNKERVPDLRVFDRDQVNTMLKTSWPACAYVVNDGTAEQPWYKRTIARWI